MFPDDAFIAAVVAGFAAGMGVCAVLFAGRLRRLSARLARCDRRTADLDLIINNTTDGIVIQTMTGRVLWANDPYLRMHRCTMDQIVGRNPLSFALPPEDRPPPADIDSYRFDPDDPQWQELQVYRNIRFDGSLFWNQIGVSFHERADGEQVSILVCRDITRQIEAQVALDRTREELHVAATRDPLTNLANRRSMMAHLSALTDRIRAGEAVAAAVVQIDIDLFKHVNDTHGHAAGDAVLCHVADVLASRCPPGSLVARPGGDEFVAVLDGIADDRALSDLVEPLFRDVSTGLRWDGRTIPTDVCLGAARLEPGDTEPDPVLIRSDHALYRAKRDGRGRCVIYDGAMRARHERASRLGLHLRNEIEDGGLEFEFQPMLDVATGAISGVEALVRWNHPVEGRLPPDRFLDLAVENGLMAELDYSAIDALFDLGRRLARDGHSGVNLGFNASPELLADPDLLSRLTEQTRASGFAPGQVVIEIRETVVLTADPVDTPAMQMIRRLRAAGFRIVLDDFGTGYAGLTHLAELPLSGIKIDRRLVRRIFADETSHKIVLAIGELCGDLGLVLVGEGVEAPKEAELLARAGCDVLQGFWLSPALPPEALRELVARHDPAGFSLPGHRPDPARRPPRPAPALRLQGAP